MLTVAVAAVREVLDLAESAAAMRGVLLGGVVVTLPASVVANPETSHLLVGHGAAILVAIEALEPLVDRELQVVEIGGAVIALVVALGAGRAVDRLDLLRRGSRHILSRRRQSAVQRGQNDRGAERDGPGTMSSE